MPKKRSELYLKNTKFRPVLKKTLQQKIDEE